MLWKIYFVVAIYVTACRGIGTTPQDAAFPTTPPTPAPLTTQPPPATVCPDDALTRSPHQRLRWAMRNIAYTKMTASIDAFLIFYSDEHLSEEPSASDRRLEYFSGWDGPGMAAVLANQTVGGAAVWVPAGEVRRAHATLSCSWAVMNEDDFSQPNVAEWIAGKVSRFGRVGADARLISMTKWEQLSFNLQREGLQLVHMPTLLDQLWDEEPEQDRLRPKPSGIKASWHQSEFTGLIWCTKVDMVRSELRQRGVDAMVVTALDEVAWLLNVRGRDLPYAPLLKAFVFISINDLRVYVPPGKLSEAVREALATNDCFTRNNTNNCVREKQYSSIYADLRRATEGKILIPTEITFQRGASAAIAHSVAQAKRMYQPSPIIFLKAQKNAAEIRGMRLVHLRDAVAMNTLLSYIEGTVEIGLDEALVAHEVDLKRAMQANYVGHSMRTRVAFGPSGADADYRATTHFNRPVYRNSTLIIQSGGQYIEGTTMVTRTLHYGAASREERRAYTSVLRALAALATLQLPAALPAAHADLAARAPLWAARQDYTHPTGHGVGAALYCREDPVVIDYRQDNNLYTLKEGYFITSEPAWYEPGKFGVRLGNVLEVLSSNQYLNFEEATLVPFEPKLIEESMLTEYEINWLNAYNRRIRNTVGPELKYQGLTDVYNWMMNKTAPLGLPSAREASQEPQIKCPETTGFRDGLYRLNLINS